MSANNNCGFSLASADGEQKCLRTPQGDNDRCIWHLHPENTRTLNIENELESASETVYDAKLSGMDLSEIHVEDVSLIGADFYGGTIRNSTFKNANLSKSIFDDQTLKNVTFINCSLDECSFNGIKTRIVDSKLVGNDHRETEFREAVFQNTAVEDIGFIDGSFFESEFKNCELNSISINGGGMNLSSFRYNDIAQCQIHNTELSSAEFHGGNINKLEIDNKKAKVAVEFADIDVLDLDIAGRSAEKISIAGCSNSSLQVSVNQIENVSITGLSGERFELSSKDINDASLTDIEVDRLSVRCNTVQNGDVDDITAVNKGKIIGMTYSGIGFTNVSLDNGEIADCQFNGTPLNGLTLETGDVIDTKFEDIEFNNSVLHQTKFKNVDFIDADLSEAVLTEAEFGDGVEFTDTKLSGSNLNNATFNGVNLEHADLETAILSNVDLRGSDLRGARLYDIKHQATRLNEDTNLGDVCVYEHLADKVAEGAITVGMDDSHHSNTDFELEQLERETDENLLIRKLKTACKATKRLYFRGFKSKAWRENQSETLSNASRVYRVYQDLLRQNGLPEEIHHYRIREKEARRKQALLDRNWLYWLRLSVLRWSIGYGERYRNVIMTSSLVIIACTMVYIGGLDNMHQTSQVVPLSDSTSQALPDTIETFTRALYFSVTTFTTLGFGDILPASNLTRTVAGIQSLIGTALTAVLVFILGRRATW